MSLTQRRGGKPKMTSSLKPKQKVAQVDVDSKGSTYEDDDEVMKMMMRLRKTCIPHLPRNTLSRKE